MKIEFLEQVSHYAVLAEYIHDVLSNFGVTTCASSQNWLPIFNKSMKRAKVKQKAEKGDLFNVDTLERGTEKSRRPPQVQSLEF